MWLFSLSHLIITDKGHGYKGSARWQIFTVLLELPESAMGDFK